MKVRDVVLGLGSNLGSREAFLRAAVDLLATEAAIEIVAKSPIWLTAPVGPPQPPYFNAALHVRTALEPEALLAAALRVERSLGRERHARWAARTIDLDVLWIDGVSFDSPSLRVPHPELLRRSFALIPLLTLVPDALDPRSGERLDAHAAALGDPGPSVSFPDRFVTEVVEHTADEGFVVHARDRADALAAATEALGALIAEPSGVAPGEAISIERALEPDAPDDERFFTWLTEVHFHLDTRRFALRRAVIQRDDERGVAGTLFGEPIDPEKHTIHGAVKAITYHALEAGTESTQGYRAQVIVDV